MERSAHSVRRFPSSASVRSLTSYLAVAVCTVMSSSTGSRQQVFHAVGLFPSKEIDPFSVVLSASGLAAEMTVTCGRSVNWPLELQRVNDALGREIENFIHHLLQCRVGQHTRTEGL